MNIAHELKSLNNAIVRRVVAIEAHNDAPTYMQGGIIMFLTKADGPRYQRDIEKHFNIRRSTATGILSNMERGGLIRRVADENDARLKKIELTEKGRMSMANFCEKMTELEAQMTKGISEEELLQFVELIHRMKDNLSE